MSDSGFPIIKYNASQTYSDWGKCHGESYRDAIKELVEIRLGLMREKNPSLDEDRIKQLATAQWAATSKFDPDITDELQGICDGSGLSREQITILNNYTDFRDIQLDDQGCSLVYANSEHGPVIGQTWDMHGSAKRYVCCLDVSAHKQLSRTVLFSLIGCVGMMGFTSHGTLLGVNNINTDGARAGVLWPALVRAALNKTNISGMVKCLTTAPVTSGHNYLLAERDHAQMWEVAPDLAEMVDKKKPGQHGFMFHTNHCLGLKMKERETVISQNSTTQIRFDLLQKKVDSVKTLDQMYALMNDHENYPKSICSNFQASTQDPSVTCGGAVGHLDSGKVVMWRGDEMYDDNFVKHEFDMSESSG